MNKIISAVNVSKLCGYMHNTKAFISVGLNCGSC